MAQLDNFRTFDIFMDRIHEAAIPNQIVVRGERSGRGFVLQLTDGGVVKPLTGVLVNLGWTHATALNDTGKPLTGLDAFEALDASRGLFKILYPSEMTVVPGVVTATIQIVDGEDETRSKSFRITVQDSPLDEEAATSSNSFSALTRALTTVSKFKGDIANLQTQKVDKGGVGQVSWGMLSQDARKNISGDKVAIVGDNSVITTNIVDKAVTGAKLADNAVLANKILRGQVVKEKLNPAVAIKKRGKNLFNKNEVVRGYIFHGPSGGLLESNNFSAYLIDVSEFAGSTLYQNRTYTHCVYDEDMNLIVGSEGGNNLIQLTANTAYVGVSIRDDLIDIYQVEVGTVGTAYQEYYDFIDADEILNKTVSVSKIIDPVLVGILSKNIFDKSKATNGYFVSYSSGELQASANFSATDFIPVVGGKTYIKNDPEQQQYALYDKNYKYLSGVAASNLIEVTADGFLRATVRTTYIDSLQIEEGNQSTEYESYGQYLIEEQLSPSLRKKINTIESGDTPKVLLPSTLYLMVNEEWSIYWRNVLKNYAMFKAGGFSVRLQERLADGTYAQLGESLGYKWYWTPTTAGTKQVEIRVVRDATQEIIQALRVNMVASAAETSAVTRKELTFGDSFTDGYGISRLIHDFITFDSYKTFNMIGLNDSGKVGVKDNAWSGMGYSWLFYNDRGTSLRSDRPLSDAYWDAGWGKGEANGWTDGQTYADLTVTQRSHGKTKNEMYNPTTKQMDFSYFMSTYMSNQKIDSVVSLYGLNDSIWKKPTDLKRSLANYRTIIRTFINQINSYDSNTKILLGLVTPQAEEDAFMSSAGTDFLTGERAKVSQEIWNEFIISEFDTDEMKSKNVTVMATHAHFDSRYGIITKEVSPVKFDTSIKEMVTGDVHPTEIGSKYIADTVRNYVSGIVF